MLRRFTSSRIRKERQKRFLVHVLLGIALAAAVLFLVIEVVQVQQLRITRIRFEGNTGIPNRELWNAMQPHVEGEYGRLFSKRNIFIVPTKAIERELTERFLRLKEVDVYREGAHTLVVSSVERQPAGIWCETVAGGAAEADGTTGSSTGCYYIDGEALAFAPAPKLLGTTFTTYERAFPSQVIGARLTAQDHFVVLRGFADSLASLGFVVQRATWKDDAIDLLVRATVTDDAYARLVLKVPLVPPYDTAFSNLASVTRTPQQETPALVVAGIDYIDLRFEHKVFFKRNGALVGETGTTTVE